MQKRIQNPMRFLTKNYFNENAQIDSPSVNFNGSGLFDFAPYKEDNVLIFNTREVQFTIWIKDEYGQFVERDCDSLFLQNINWKDFVITGTLASGGSVELANITGNTQTDFKVNFGTASFSQIIFSITDVMTSENTIRAGQLRLCKFIMDLVATTETNVAPVVDEGNIRTFDGSLASWVNFEKWGARINIRNIKKEQYDLLKGYIKRDKFVTIIPWTEWEARDVYEILISRGQIGTYAVNRWSGLISQTLNVEAKEDATN